MDGIYVKPSDENVWKYFDLNGVKKFVRPSCWRYDEKGSLQAYEFVESDIDSTPEPSKQFAETLYQLLLANNLEKLFGISLIETDGNTDVGLETTDEGRRANVVTFTDQAPNGYRAANWRFVPENKGSIIQRVCYWKVGCLQTRK